MSVIDTIVGPREDTTLRSFTRFEEQPDAYLIQAEWLASQDDHEVVVKHVAYRLDKTQADGDGMLMTTHGNVPVATLAHTVMFKNLPNEYLVTAEWHIGEELVRRDCHVVLKAGSVIADGIASSF